MKRCPHALLTLCLLLPVASLTACDQSTGGGRDAAETSPAREQTGAPDPLAAWRPSVEEEAAAVAVVQRLFDALETGDEALLREVMDPSVVMHFTETRDGETTFGSATVDGLAARITTSEVPLIERLWDPTVLVNGELATVWTPYDFYVGSDFSHCGIDVATILNDGGVHRIVALSWTRLQPPACELHPDGPPGA
jgi:hypothetical protein